MQHLPEVQWGRVMCRVESPEKSLEWEVLGETWTSVAGRPALGHPLIAVATFLRGTSRFQQERLRKDKDITFRDRAHPTLRNPAHPIIHLIPAEGKAAEAKPKDWAVTGGVSAWLWFGAFPWTVLWTWLVLPPHMRANRNSQIPADPTGLHIRGSALPRSGKYSASVSDVWLWDRGTHLPSSTASDQHLPLMGDPVISSSWFCQKSC